MKIGDQVTWYYEHHVGSNAHKIWKTGKIIDFSKDGKTVQVKVPSNKYSSKVLISKLRIKEQPNEKA